jgi:DNA-binding winged helix-turn-helix (wHTH) protein/TolB-like protein/Flp pilus assembly protein TadD
MTSAPSDPATDPAPQALRVGDWRVQPDLNRITRGALEVRLEPKAMAVLMYLASRPGQVASREALLASVWPGVIVGDNALTQVVIKLRRALGDTAREPAYIESIAKKGYRLLADVRPAAAPEPEASAAPPAATRRPRYAWVAAGVAIVLLAAGAAWFLHSMAERTGASEAIGQRDPARAAALPTVQVEPFEVIGSAPEPALIARALTADLVTDLSKVSGLWVVGAGRASEPGGERPRYALSGTVQQDGERLRLNVLLTDRDADRPLWSERFDRRVQDLFDLQGDLVKRILEVLPVRVSEAEMRRVAQRSTRNLPAFELFMRAQAALLVRRPEQNLAARALYWEAIGHDAAFARAYAGLAMTYALDHQQGWAKDDAATIARALEFAQAAIRLRPDLPEAHWVLAFVATQRRQHDEALRDLAEALRLNPSYADAYALEGGIRTYIGQPAQSIALLQQALRLQPDAGSLYFLLLGRDYYFLGDGEQARFNLNRALERNPQNLEARIYLAAVQWQAGDWAAAEWQASEIRSLEPGFEAGRWLANYPLTDAAELRTLRSTLGEIGL